MVASNTHADEFFDCHESANNEIDYRKKMYPDCPVKLESAYVDGDNSQVLDSKLIVQV